ncbi:glycosyltransferase family 20 protein [Patellaria atrata CBS 101060]|uniref:Glycosyltransferase family 20 protein n=1 Tax=Patellaria atrata CBS 101060 TaxID=1346257 RepID=A0A9P4VWR3_9PEZI|nr:glycosyltransferase family 20 protein [Patellaria atrata CBS 101060]
MPVFVVSLFLPYTVDFHDATPNESTPASKPEKRLPLRNSSIPDLKNLSTLLTTPTPPRTPAATADHIEFFSQFQPSPASHFPQPHVPRSLMRSDPHVPEWGKGAVFNQPRSRAGPTPPDTILEAGKAQDLAELQARAIAGSTKRSRRPSARDIRSPRAMSSERSQWQSGWSVEPAVEGNGGLANAIRAASEAGRIGDTFWVGTIGFPTDVLEQSQKDEIHEKLESEYEALTVFVEDSDFTGHYVHYCKTILWPLFHYQIPDHPKSKAYQDHSWKYYVTVNQAFADKIVRNYKRGDVIWIHDYHLLLAPGMVRKKLPDAQIGFFLHAAFPSSEVFRCLAMRKELLDGMLGANLVGFQTKEYAHHFLQTCSRLLIVETTHEGVQLDQRFVNVVSLPIGINPEGLGIAREHPNVLDWIRVIEARYEGKRLIVCRDKLDNVGGVRHKLLAFELFLNKYPEWRDKVVMIQVATSTTENPELAATVSDIVTRIDSTHSNLAHQPLIFLRQDIPFSQYLALLSVADAIMITSLREGMNLTAHEYILCQDGASSKKRHGPLILSEFTGSASIFGGQELSVNPWDFHWCAEAIRIALRMDSVERERRYIKLRDVVMDRTGENWCTTLFDTLDKVYKEQNMRDTMSIPRLALGPLKSSYKVAERRLFILDFEGTLASYSIDTSLQRVFDTLKEMTLDDKNIVYITSGRKPEDLERLFNTVPGLGMIAENGCFVKESDSNTWIQFPDSQKMKTWKESVKGMLDYYTQRIEGSYIEERHCYLIFHYENANDAESAARQAGDCANHINDSCENQRIHAVPTEKALLIEPVDWSKGTAVKHVFKNACHTVPDFLLVAGDDREDEIVFRWAKRRAAKGNVKHVTTVSVGNRNTEAMATLTQGTPGLLSVLQKLVTGT